MKKFSILYTRPFGWGFSGGNGVTACNETVNAKTAEQAGTLFLRANLGKGYVVKAIDEICA